MSDAGMALAVAFTAALATLSLVLLAVLIVRYWWRRRDGGAASSRGGFVLFDVCFQDDRRRQAARPLSMARTWRQESLEHSPREEAPGDDHHEPDESELSRWKRMFRSTTRSLSTIDEGTEKGTTPVTTPAFCTPPGSPDRRDARARALDMASIAVQVKP
ncbi:hypothetical protein PR202_gb04113 [Eleusine coracana subsp. coracana]|uniref:Uncharacterized protein n=1 Tax=Eleusine coracana subsp. coracana TaxID=191504 RepID=A0AAV5E3R4_ELECO|nr:hypothetical protein QOZ80_1BG0090940 [Eleusine coracana subsp. coracana]GJN17074.1 hypothetical protein PR202_gb04113 [Eleusine coracana subsp. coracana]